MFCAVLPISVLLLFADSKLLPGAFATSIGDTCSLWIFYAISQKYVDASVRRDSASYFQQITTPACCARFPYVSPNECWCIPHITNASENGQLLPLTIAFTTVAISHRLTNLAKKDKTFENGVLFMIAPFMHLVGFTEWTVSWTNWIICNVVAIFEGLGVLAHTIQGFAALIQHYQQLYVILKQQGVAFEKALWAFHRFPLIISWLFAGFWFTSNYLYSTKTGNSHIVNFMDGVTSSPFTFTGQCAFSALLCSLLVWLFVCFISSTVDNTDLFNADVQLTFFWCFFAEGVLYYSFGQSIHLMFIHTYVLVVAPVVYKTTILLLNEVALSSYWFDARARFVCLLVFATSLCSIYTAFKFYGLFSFSVICMLQSSPLCIEMMGFAITHTVYALETIISSYPWDTIVDLSSILQVWIIRMTVWTANSIDR
jgi:hypothetical protein